jgi:hypoxanthine phosphoribosyltransferase
MIIKDLNNSEQFVKRVLFSEEQLRDKVKELGQQITKDYEGKEVLIVCILKGGAMFMSDLSKEIKLPIHMDFMAVSSYGNSTSSSGVVQILKDLSADIKGKDIVIVEDIIDSGLTLKYLQNYLMQKGPNSIKICTLLDKPERRKSDVKVDYTGFVIDDCFVCGYGLDYAEMFRNVPYIFELKEEVWQ